MASLNKVVLIGHMTADPELKQTPNGVNVCSFSIGVTRRYTRAGETPQSDFINIVVDGVGRGGCVCGGYVRRSP